LFRGHLTSSVVGRRKQRRTCREYQITCTGSNPGKRRRRTINPGGVKSKSASRNLVGAVVLFLVLGFLFVLVLVVFFVVL
jgi:hypothetical protein